MSDFRRVTVTIPANVLEAADRLAAHLDRSRSWVVANALRRMTAHHVAQAMTGHAVVSATPPGAVGEQRLPPAELAASFRAAEQSRIESDLALTPEQRVEIAEEISRIVPEGRRPPRFSRVMQFESFEDYLDWKRFAELEP